MKTCYALIILVTSLHTFVDIYHCDIDYFYVEHELLLGNVSHFLLQS